MDDTPKDTLLVSSEGKVRTLDHEQVWLTRPNVFLESCFSVPKNADPEARKLAVLVHPWARFGGKMDDPVLLAINNRLLEKGYYVMRYAARGSGSTTRRATFTGLQEGVDLQELVRWVRGEMTGVKTILLVGYSFGALSASLFPILPDPEIKIHHILLSYPLGRRSLMTAFKSSHYATTLNNLLQNPQASVLVIYGNKDGVTSERSYDKWAEELKGQAKLEVMKIAGATHHWPEENGVRQSMLSIVEDWVP